MRFPVTFTRYIGTIPSGGKQLGNDVLLVDGNGNPIKNLAGTDNFLASRMISMNGWPVNRIAFAGKYTGAGPAVPGSVQIYTFEDNLGCWLPLPCSSGANPTYTCGTNAAPSAPIYFDAISLVDLPHVQADLAQSSGGTGQYLIIVGAGTSPPNGTYQFIVGAELTNVI
jgi:hypothetical protein